MSYFDPRRKTEIVVDARPFGGYAIRVLSHVEPSLETERDASCSMGRKVPFFICMFMV